MLRGTTSGVREVSIAGKVFYGGTCPSRVEFSTRQRVLVFF